jgi:hypothetical protein
MSDAANGHAHIWFGPASTSNMLAQLPRQPVPLQCSQAIPKRLHRRVQAELQGFKTTPMGLTPWLHAKPAIFRGGGRPLRFQCPKNQIYQNLPSLKRPSSCAPACATLRTSALPHEARSGSGTRVGGSPPALPRPVRRGAWKVHPTHAHAHHACGDAWAGWGAKRSEQFAGVC